MTNPVRHYPPVRADGRRGVILRSTIDDFRTLPEVTRAIIARFGAPTDAALESIRTRRALKDLQRAGLVAKTPYGWRCTRAGQDMIEGRAA